MIQNQNQLTQGAFILGLEGLLPQLASCIVAFNGDEYRMYALVSGFAYSALIFSFIGGVWWGQALSTSTKHTWIFIAAVCPSLIAWGAALLLFLNLKLWPYAIGAIAIGLLISPLIDVQINKVINSPIGWMKLRIILSIGLGFLTLMLSILTLHAI
jgi:hypothetical protein